MYYQAKRYLSKAKRCLLKQLFWLRHCASAFQANLTYGKAKDILNVYWPENKARCYRTMENDGISVYDCSIIVPVYNAEKYLDKCLDSIESQKTQYKVQVIIVNDGSTDATDDILKRYYNKCDWFIIHQSNRGLSAARNVGIAHAQGKYLMFVDADDTLTDNSIENMLKAAFSNHADFVAGGHRDVLPNDCTVIYVKEYADRRVSPLGVVSGHAWAKIYDKRLFTHLQFPEGYWYEDSILAHIVFPMVQNAYTISNVVYNHMINPEGIISQSVKTPRTVESLYIVEQLLKEKKNFGLKYTIQDYDQFLRAVRLTYARTCVCSTEIARSIFSVQCELYTYFDSERYCGKRDDLLTEALEKKNYLKYLISVWKGIWMY